MACSSSCPTSLPPSLPPSLQMYEDLSVVSTAVDILNLIAEFNVSILREHALQTKDNSNEVGYNWVWGEGG